MAYDKKYYEEKLNKLKVKNQEILQGYINAGLKFGQDIAELNIELREVQQLIIENAPKEEPKQDDKKIAPIRK